MNQAMVDRELRSYRERHTVLLDIIDRQMEQSVVNLRRIRRLLLRSLSILDMVHESVWNKELLRLLLLIFCAAWNMAQEIAVSRTSSETTLELTVKVSTAEKWLMELIVRYGEELWREDVMKENTTSYSVLWDVLEDYVQLTDHLLKVAGELIAPKRG